MRFSIARYGIVLLLLTLVGVGVYFAVPRGNKVEVYSDTVPVELEIGDNKYSMDNKQLVISLGENSYQYRASALVDGKEVVLGGDISFANSKKQILRLNYSLYSKQAVTNALCETFSGSCPFSSKNINITYLENHQWAVVVIDTPSLGRAKAVLQTIDGRWEVSDGPATNIETGGYYPGSVEEALNEV